MHSVIIVPGNLLNQDVEVIVNPWNRNIIPWWLLLSQGVSGEIKKRAGYAPFRELAKCGPLPLGSAVLTSPGRLSFKGIIHVAGINLLWRATEKSIRMSVDSALEIVRRENFRSVAFPAIGAGTGGFGRDKAIEIIAQQAANHGSAAQISIVRYCSESKR